MDTMGTMERTGRKVYGIDYVVTYSPRRDMVFVQEITCHQGMNGRFTANDLLSILGHATEPGVLQFVKNNNLHTGGRGGRGALVLKNKCIGLAVHTRGSTLLFKALLPRSLHGSFELLDLTNRDRHFGFYLQQVRGERLGELQSWYRSLTRDESYPYSHDGFVYMYPGGPDVYVAGKVPQEIQSTFESVPDDLCTRTYTQPSLIVRKQRKKKTTVVCYVADSESRLNMHGYANRFFIPIGDEVGKSLCPWILDDNGEPYLR